jgi:hypothetical protein
MGCIAINRHLFQVHFRLVRHNWSNPQKKEGSLMRIRHIHCRLILFYALLFIVLTACSTSAATQPKATGTTPTATTRQVIGAPGCKPPSAIDNSATGLPESRGVGKGMEIWALWFNDRVATHDQKIVWRMTGSGDPQFTTTGPHGEKARVVFGPEEHGSSNWHHNGDEWGTGFNFPVSGCWNLHVTRGQATGDIWVMLK